VLSIVAVNVSMFEPPVKLSAPVVSIRIFCLC
jgi:hypothetical protein